MERCGMAVIQTNTGKVFGCDLSVFLHVGPQVRAVLWLLAVTQLHTVSPADQLSPQVHLGA